VCVYMLRNKKQPHIIIKHEADAETAERAHITHLEREHIINSRTHVTCAHIIRCCRLREHSKCERTTDRDDKFHFVSRRSRESQERERPLRERRKGLKKNERRDVGGDALNKCDLLMARDASIKRAASRIATRLGLGPYFHLANYTV
jgi:hypothetical protein